jgi:hypothetical protein
LLPFVTILEGIIGQSLPTDGGWRSENLLLGNGPALTSSFFTGGGVFYRPVKIPLRSENHPMTEARQTVSMHQCGFFGKFYLDVFFCSESAIACSKTCIIVVFALHIYKLCSAKESNANTTPIIIRRATRPA